jgi:hypothetical protein
MPLTPFRKSSLPTISALAILAASATLIACSSKDDNASSELAAPPTQSSMPGPAIPPAATAPGTTPNPVATPNPDATPGPATDPAPNESAPSPSEEPTSPNLDPSAEPDPSASGPEPSTPAPVESNPPVEVAAAPGVTSTLLVPGAELSGGNGFSSDQYATLPVAVDPAADRVLVGYNDASAPSTGVLAASDGSVVEIPDAVVAGVAFTSDGFAALLFDPNEDVDARVWAAVVRFANDGTELFRTELFHSPNLDDEGTKGAPSTSRFAYLTETDSLVAYFAHTQRYDDGVRHQGGYLALVDAAGEQELLNGWFGSHNLDQRLAVDGAQAYVLGIGDAYPEGIFFDAASSGDNVNPTVLQPLAAAGNGATNGQLGGLVNLQDELLIPFITNRSVAPDLDAGTWPDIDETIADQIRDAAANGTDLGLMRVAKPGLVDDDTTLEVTWLDVQLGADARLEKLKSAPFGVGNVVLAWAEVTGDSRNGEESHFSMVIDAAGGTVQPKASLEDAYAFSSGDDFVARANGGVVWASAQDDGIYLVTMNP